MHKKMLVFEDLDAFHVVLRRKAQLSCACYYTQHLILSSSPYQGFLSSGIEMQPNMEEKHSGKACILETACPWI